MSRLRFDGQGAGLNKRLSGDQNSPHDYTVICSCERDLGPMGKFFPNKDGERTALCLRCEKITIISKDGSIEVVDASKEILGRVLAAK